MRYFSMFSGIGGFEYGIQNLGTKPQNSTDTEGGTPQHSISPLCVGYSEIDKYAIKVYERNFNESCDEHAHISQESKQKERTQRRKRSTDKQGLQLHDRNRSAALCNKCKGHTNYGNATTINAAKLPDFDLLVGGFPCQAFSIAGKRAGFDDTRGTLFFDIARILKEKQPRNLVLENVKGLLSHDGGRTFTTIIGVLADLGYFVEWQVLNSKDFGVPQNRERVFIVGHLGGEPRQKVFPITGTNRANTYVRTIRAGGAGSATEKHARDLIAVRQPLRFLKRNQKNIEGDYTFTIDSTNTGGVKVESRIRRLTPKECERLQGFSDDWTKYGIGDEPISDTQRYKMCGNAVTVNVVEAVMTNLRRVM